MKRLLALLVVLLLVFYVAWPGWTGYQISSAIKARDSATLERKISFADVRASLKPTAVQKIGQLADQIAQQGRPINAALASQLKSSDLAMRVADTALEQLVTAPNLIRVVNDGGALKDSAERLFREQVGKVGGIQGLGGGAIQLPGGLGQINIPGLGPKPSASPVSTVPSDSKPAPGGTTVGGGGEHPGFGYANVKHFGFVGPLGFEIGVAKDAKASEADVIVEMRFVGSDWRVVGVRPRI